MFFGVGFIEPVDDIRAGNPPSNPELLERLIGAEGTGTAEMVVGGRYLDVMEKRGDEWRILERVCVHEHTHSQAVDPMQIDAEKFRQGNFDRPAEQRPVGP